MVYVFIPLLPTQEAYEQREFPNMVGIPQILDAMEVKEVSRGQKYTGTIYFHPGIVSTHNDGTRNKSIDPTGAEKRAWATLDANRTQAGVDACVREFQEILWRGKQLSYRAQNFMAYTDDFRLQAVDQLLLPPLKREYQNFRHVYDLRTQLGEIRDHGTIRKLWINDVGYFEPE
jgi:hypothetical protein